MKIRMKSQRYHWFWLSAVCILANTSHCLSDRESDLVILDKLGVRNLGIETEVVTRRDFDETLFALGRLHSKPGGHAYVTSRIPGRLVDIMAHEGDYVKKGDRMVVVESLQPGNPPPSQTFYAPIDGLVVKSFMHLGEPVVPEKPILEVINLKEMYAVAKVPEDKVSLIKPDTRAEIRVAAYPDTLFTGTWERFGTMADASNATLDAYFLISDPSGKIRPEMRTEFTLHLDSHENVMSVPIEALQGDHFQPFVFVRDFELPNSFLKAPVTTGARNTTHVEILTGLFPGDQVVIKGAYPLAFAGSGGVSLKDALDAAHGHEHNEDGSELTAEQKAAKNAANNSSAGQWNAGPLTWFLGILCIGQWVLLLLRGKGRGGETA